MGTYIDIFDFKTIFLEYFLGTPTLVSFALLLVIAYASAYFNMSSRNFGLILLISSMVFAYYIGAALFFLILIIVGFSLFIIFKRLVQ